MSTINVGDILDAAISRTQTSYSNMNVKLKTAVDQTLRDVVFGGDRQRLIQVLSTILETCRRWATNGGTVEMSACTGFDSIDGGMKAIDVVMIMITYRGTHSPANVEHMFDPFVAMENMGKAETGLGGDVRFESVVG